jgi:ubiquinone biosynthesis protein COQ9
MSTPERSPERDAAIEALLPYVAVHGWTLKALVAAAGPDADLLFPGGPADMVEAYCDLADRWMEADAAELPTEGVGVTERVRAVIRARLQRNEPYKEAVRRALGVLTMPGRGVLAVQATARTVDAIWYAAGDRSADFNWYTKRATLAAIYTSTLLFWLRDRSENSTDTMAFVDRRLSFVSRFGQFRRKLSKNWRKGLSHA